MSSLFLTFIVFIQFYHVFHALFRYDDFFLPSEQDKLKIQNPNNTEYPDELDFNSSDSEMESPDQIFELSPAPKSMLPQYKNGINNPVLPKADPESNKILEKNNGMQFLK